MRGQLCSGMLVDLDDDTARYGGAWQGEVDGVLQAYDQGAIWRFWTHIKDLSAPVVLDVGANTGSFCLLAAFHPGMTGYVFEPNPVLQRVLYHNLGLNGLDKRMDLAPFGVLDYVGSALLTVLNDERQSGLSYIDIRTPASPAHVQDVLVITLDEFCRMDDVPHVDAIKLDVEGREVSALSGGKGVIQRDHPFIFSEATHVERQVSLLQSWGYTVTIGKNDLEATYEG